MAKGGARPGSGRKPKHEEDRVKAKALKAIRDTYGSEDKGFRALLRSQEPSLIKFVWEHAYGKPKETIKHEGDGIQKLLTIDPLSNIEDESNNSPS